MGSRKSTRSIDAVTTDARLCRNAAIAAVLSIIERITPPNTCPMLFACSGIMSSDVSCWLSRTGLDVRMGARESIVCGKVKDRRYGCRVAGANRDARALAVRRGLVEGALELLARDVAHRGS